MLCISIHYTSTESSVQFNISFQTEEGFETTILNSLMELSLRNLSRAVPISITITTLDECGISSTLNTSTGK